MSQLAEIWEMPVVGARYRHKKGNIYLVIGVAQHTETNEWLTIYVHEDHPNVLWARPVAMFMDEGRFEQINDGNPLPHRQPLATEETDAEQKIEAIHEKINSAETPEQAGEAVADGLNEFFEKGNSKSGQSTN